MDQLEYDLRESISKIQEELDNINRRLTQLEKDVHQGIIYGKEILD